MYTKKRVDREGGILAAVIGFSKLDPITEMECYGDRSSKACCKLSTKKQALEKVSFVYSVADAAISELIDLKQVPDVQTVTDLYNVLDGCMEKVAVKFKIPLNEWKKATCPRIPD